jgi:hypothetical protein
MEKDEYITMYKSILADVIRSAEDGLYQKTEEGKVPEDETGTSDSEVPGEVMGDPLDGEE